MLALGTFRNTLGPALACAAAGVLFTWSAPSHAIVCDYSCYDFDCGRRFPNGLAGRILPSNALIDMTFRCGPVLPEGRVFPELTTTDGQVLESQWMPVATVPAPPSDAYGTEETPASAQTYMRVGPAFPEGVEVVASDTWPGSCWMRLYVGSCSGSEVVCNPSSNDAGVDAGVDGGPFGDAGPELAPSSSCCDLDGAPRELFRFRTAANDVEAPGGVELSVTCSVSPTVYRIEPRFSLAGEASDVVSVELAGQSPTATAESVLARWHAPVCLESGDARVFSVVPAYGFPFWAAPLASAEGQWQLVARAFDEAGNVAVSDVVTLRVPDDCDDVAEFPEPEPVTHECTRGSSFDAQSAARMALTRPYSDLSCLPEISGDLSQGGPTFSPTPTFGAGGVTSSGGSGLGGASKTSSGGARFGSDPAGACGCEVGGRSSRRATPWLLALALVLVVHRRRGTRSAFDDAVPMRVGGRGP